MTDDMKIGIHMETEDPGFEYNGVAVRKTPSRRSTAPTMTLNTTSARNLQPLLKAWYTITCRNLWKRHASGLSPRPELPLQGLLDRIHVGGEGDGPVGVTAFHFLQFFLMIAHLELGELEAVGRRYDNSPVIF